MFNDVLLGGKSSSSRCLHAEDGGELPRLPGCLRSGGDAPTPHRSGRCPSTGAQLAWHWERLAQVFGWVLKKLLHEVELMKGFQVISVVTEQVNTENILPVFSTGHGCQGLLPLRSDVDAGISPDPGVSFWRNKLWAISLLVGDPKSSAEARACQGPHSKVVRLWALGL